MSLLTRAWVATSLLAFALPACRAQSALTTIADPLHAAVLHPELPSNLPIDPSAALIPPDSTPQAAELKPDRPYNHAGDVASVDYPSLEERRKSYLFDLIGPRAFLGAAASALVDQASEIKVGYPSDGAPGPGKHPAHGVVPEWGQGLRGYGKRYGSEFGLGFISTTSKYAIGEALHQDVTYHSCDCPGHPIQRLFHLLTGSYAARTEHGRTVPSIPIFVSPFIASEAAVHIWYPSRFNSSDAIRISLSPLYTLPIRNLIAEYGNH
jgi:hypothetical protein